MRHSKRPIVVLFLATAFLLAAFAVYKVPSPASTFMHTQVHKTHAVMASYDWGADLPMKPTVTRISSADGMIQVFIPAGEFLMGTNEKNAQKNRPAHWVSLSAFWMDQTEVTNAMYKKCVEAKECSLPWPNQNPFYGKSKYDDYPVVYVTWKAADTYCHWAERRLPTEAEWEEAARGSDGRAYPWGNDAPEMRLANFDLNIGAPIDASRYPLGASPYGMLNMAGNVREWVADWFNEFYYLVSPRDNPKGPPSGELKSLRGGSYLDGGSEIRVFNRFSHDPKSPGINRGFRCASDAEE